MPPLPTVTRQNPMTSADLQWRRVTRSPARSPRRYAQGNINAPATMNRLPAMASGGIVSIA
jgi:hypothetical protein